MIVIGVSIVGGAISSAALGLPEKDDPNYQFGEFLSFGFTLPLIFLWVRFEEDRRFSSVGFRGANPVRNLLLGGRIGAVMMAAGVLVVAAMGQYDTGMSEHINVGSAAIGFLRQVSPEEAVLRGGILQTGGLQLPGGVAVFGSSVIFSDIHMGFSPIVLPTITRARRVRLLRGAGSGIIVAHLRDSHRPATTSRAHLRRPGQRQPGGELPALVRAGAGIQRAARGGDFGVEAGLIGTLALAIALVIALVCFRGKQAGRAPALPALPAVPAAA